MKNPKIFIITYNKSKKIQYIYIYIKQSEVTVNFKIFLNMVNVENIKNN